MEATAAKVRENFSAHRKLGPQALASIDLELIKDPIDPRVYFDRQAHGLTHWKNNRPLTRPTYLLTRIFVPLSCRRQGVGSSLLSEVTDWLKAAGYQLIAHASTYGGEDGPTNAELVSWYTKRGFVVVPDTGGLGLTFNFDISGDWQCLVPYTTRADKMAAASTRLTAAQRVTGTAHVVSA